MRRVPERKVSLFNVPPHSPRKKSKKEIQQSWNSVGGVDCPGCAPTRHLRTGQGSGGARVSMLMLTLKRKSPQTPHLPSKEQKPDPRARAPPRELSLGVRYIRTPLFA